MRGALYINDWDAWNVRFVLETPEGEESAPSVLERTTLLPTRVGAIPLARESETTTREISLGGVVLGSSLTDCRDKIDELKGRLFNGAIEVRFKPRLDRFVLARCLGLDLIGTPPKFANPRARIAIRLLCPDPLIYAVGGSVVGFSGTAAPCPLGTAVSFPVIRIHGAVTNPVLTYRDVRGTARKTMGFTVALGVNDYLEVDSERAAITKYAAGVASDGMSLWTSGDVFDGLDPQDADPVGGLWPTLEVSPAATAEALYRKAWL